MNITRKKYRVGELRPSQVLFTYGIGAIVDLPYISTMVMGLDDWKNPYPEPIGEERLLQAVKSILGPQVSRLLSPPEAPEQGGMPNPFDESATWVCPWPPSLAGCSARAAVPWPHWTPACFNSRRILPGRQDTLCSCELSFVGCATSRFARTLSGSM